MVCKMRLGLALVALSVVMFKIAAFPTLVESATSPFSVTVTAPAKPFKVGVDIKLPVTITNTSQKVITFSTFPGMMPDDTTFYTLTIKDDKGRIVPPIAPSEDDRVPKTFDGSRVLHTLQPGEKFADEVNVTRVFDLAKPGKYSISLSLPVPSGQNLGEGSVKSNAVKVVVLSAD